MTEHISTAQWTQFYSGTISETEKLRILQHAAECEECRKLMEKANDLRFALRRQQESVSLADSEGEEYRAVAGPSKPSGKTGVTGFLSVQLVQGKNGYCFDEDSIESSGTGNKYAMNASEDARSLEDDGKALSLTIETDSVCVLMTDTGARGFVHLLTEDPDTPDLPLSPEVRLALPPGGFCELEIVFEEE